MSIFMALSIAAMMVVEATTAVGGGKFCYYTIRYDTTCNETMRHFDRIQTPKYTFNFLIVLSLT